MRLVAARDHHHGGHRALQSARGTLRIDDPMDDKLVPFMAALFALLLLGVGYAGFAYWRTRRGVAWNVVNAALALRTLDAEQRRTLDRAVMDALPGFRMSPQAFEQALPVVRLALYSIVMQRLGIAAPDPARPFRPLASPQLARSVGSHLRVARFHAETAHGVQLSELDAASGG